MRLLEIMAEDFEERNLRFYMCMFFAITWPLVSWFCCWSLGMLENIKKKINEN